MRSLTLALWGIGRLESYEENETPARAGVEERIAVRDYLCPGKNCPFYG
jgi:hypothetical protein